MNSPPGIYSLSRWLVLRRLHKALRTAGIVAETPTVPGSLKTIPFSDRPYLYYSISLRCLKYRCGYSKMITAFTCNSQKLTLGSSLVKLPDFQNPRRLTFLTQSHERTRCTRASYGRSRRELLNFRGELKSRTYFSRFQNWVCGIRG